MSHRDPQGDEVTLLLASWRSGNRDALNRLSKLVEPELRRIAHHHLRGERAGHSVQVSSLIQEAFVHLLRPKDYDSKVVWRDRTHFFAVASTVMRHVLVDHARARLRLKRGAAVVHVPIDSAALLTTDQTEQIVLIDLALQRLAEIDNRKSKVLEMRLFAGLSVVETAEALGIAPNTVTRDWNFARAWLRKELSGSK